MHVNLNIDLATIAAQAPQLFPTENQLTLLLVETHKYEQVANSKYELLLGHKRQGFRSTCRAWRLLICLSSRLGTQPRLRTWKLSEQPACSMVWGFCVLQINP